MPVNATQRERGTNVTPESFDKLVIESPIPVLVSFHTPWSEAMVPPYGRLAEAFAGHVRVVAVNIVTHPELAARYKIRVVPTLLVFKGGVPVEFIVGTVPNRFVLETVEKALGIRLDTTKAGSTKLQSQCEWTLGLVHSSTLG